MHRRPAPPSVTRSSPPAPSSTASTASSARSARAAMGQVFRRRARRARSHRPIKVMHAAKRPPRRTPCAAFVREGRAGRLLKSDHAVRINDVGRFPSGRPYLVMEYLEGGTWSGSARATCSRSTTSWTTTLQALSALCRGARPRGLVHRDIKPQRPVPRAALRREGPRQVLDLRPREGAADSGASASALTDRAQCSSERRLHVAENPQSNRGSTRGPTSGDGPRRCSCS